MLPRRCALPANEDHDRSRHGDSRAAVAEAFGEIRTGEFDITGDDDDRTVLGRTLAVDALAQSRGEVVAGTGGLGIRALVVVDADDGTVDRWSARAGRGCEDFDGAPGARSASDPPVTGEECRVQRFRQRDVGGVVNREVVAELPAAQHERPVIDPLHGKGLQVVQGEGHAPWVELAAAGEAPPYGHNLKVDQARRREVLAVEAGTQVVSVVVIVEQGDGQDAGINDEHARTVVHSRRRPRTACRRLGSRHGRAPPQPSAAGRPG